MPRTGSQTQAIQNNLYEIEWRLQIAEEFGTCIEGNMTRRFNDLDRTLVCRYHVLPKCDYLISEQGLQNKRVEDVIELATQLLDIVRAHKQEMKTLQSSSASMFLSRYMTKDYNLVRLGSDKMEELVGDLKLEMLSNFGRYTSSSAPRDAAGSTMCRPSSGSSPQHPGNPHPR